MSDSPPIELVLFDLGGVLIRLANDRAHAAQIADVNLPKLGEEALQAWMDCRDAHEVGEVDCDGFLSRITTISGLSDDDHRRLYRAWLQGPFRGVTELVDDLLGSSCTLGCLSNTNDFHWAMMNARVGDNTLPLHRMHYRFASHLIGKRKPGQEIYRRVEHAVAIPASRILFFDDTLPNIETARTLGWCGEHITDTDDPVSQMRDVLKSYGVLTD